MTRCPKCSEENSDTAAFCSRCHQTLLFRCPMCWHEQLHTGKCDSCGVDMTMYWKRQFAIARADEVKHTHELSPDLTPDPSLADLGLPRNFDELLQSIPHDPFKLLKFALMLALRFFGVSKLPRIS
jgi:hypothetical protein